MANPVKHPVVAPKSVKFAVEPFGRVYREAQHLMRLHWQEIAKNKTLLRINPDLEKYMAGGKNLVTVTARDDKTLVGYFLWALVPHPHYKHVKVAEEDLHYLHPEWRRGLAGYLFMKAACAAAAEAGAQLIVVREKIGHEHPAILKRLKFSPTDIVYTLAVPKA